MRGAWFAVTVIIATGITVGCVDSPLEPRVDRKYITFIALADPNGTPLGMTEARGINQAGTVVGYGGPGGTRAVRWSPSNGLQHLFPTGVVSWAWDISDGAVVVGFTTSLQGGGFRLSGGVLEALQPLPGHFYTEAYAINSTETAAGVSTNGNGSDHAVIWDTNGNVTPLGVLPGTDQCVAFDINDMDFVVGYCNNSASSETYAFRWSAATGMVGLAGSSSEAYGINNANYVVGSIGGPSGSLGATGVMWRPDGTVVVLPASVGSDINNRGQVVGHINLSSGGRDLVVWDSLTGMRVVASTSHGLPAINAGGEFVASVGLPTTRQSFLWRIVSDSIRVLIEALPGDSLVSFPKDPLVATDDSTMTLQISVVNSSGQRMSNRDITLTLEALPAPNGGHHHSAARPAGTLNDSTVTTDSTGYAVVTYFAPEPSGVLSVIARSTGATDGLANLLVQVPGLVQVQDGGNIDTIGVKPEHPSAHWATPQMRGALLELADSLAATAQRLTSDSLPDGEVFPAVLAVNDISLAWGGILDISDYDWMGDHRSHRRGTNADVRIRGTGHTTYRRLAREYWLRELTIRHTRFYIHPPGPNEHVHLTY